MNGLTGLAITKLDVLDTFDEVPVGTGYDLERRHRAKACRPTSRRWSGSSRYTSVLQGWKRSTGEARKLADLPSQARAYLDRIEELSGVPIRYVSVGTRRDQIIEV